MNRLAPNQKDIFVEQKIFDDLPMFNIGGYAIFRQAIDVEVFCQAQSVLENRFDIFGLSFSEQQSGLSQQIRQTRGQIEFVDFSTDEDPTASALARLKCLYSKRFELDKDILYRTCLFKLANEEYWYVCLAHHLITDGWGYTLWLKDVCRIYSNLLRGAEALDAIESIDFLTALGAQKAGRDLSKSRQFWQNELATLPPLVFGNKHHSGDLAQDYRSHRVSRHITQQHAMHWRAENRHTIPVSLQSMLMAALSVYFFQTTQQSKFLVGQPLHNRSTAGLKRSYGNFLSMGVSKVELEPDWQVSELFQWLHEQKRKEFRHQKLPIAELNQLASYDRAERSLLYDIELNYQKLSYKIDAELIDGETHFWHSQYQKSALIITLCDYGEQQRLELHADFHSDVFADAEQADAFLLRLITLIDWFVEHFEQPIMAAPVLSAADLRGWERFNMQPDNTYVPDSLAQLTAQKSAFTQQVRCNAMCLSGEQFKNTVHKATIKLQQHGVKAGDRVALNLKRDANLPAWLFAIWQLQAVYVPLSRAWPDERVSYVLNDSHPQVIVSDYQQQAECEHAVQVISAALDEVQLSDAAPLSWSISPDSLAYIIYTSGTTGAPKGVMVSHRALAAFLSAMHGALGTSQGAFWLASTTVGFDISILELVYPILYGQDVYVSEEGLFQRPEHLQALLSNTGINTIQATPTAWRVLLNSGWSPRADLTLLCGGEALGPDLAAALSTSGNRLFNFYGPTEATIWATVMQFQAGAEVSIGRPLTHSQAYVVNPQGQLMPPLVTGELVLTGPCLAQGYWQNPALTKQKFTTLELGGHHPQRVYHTGDQAYLNADNQLIYVGRNDRQIKFRGVRVELAEIESKLRAIENVEDAYVTLVTRADTHNEVLVAYLKTPRAIFNEARAVAQLKQSLPAYLIPTRFECLDTFPLNDSGKVAVNAFPAIGWESTGPAVVSDNQIEQILLETWQQMLGRNDFSVDDNFFDMGASSLDVVNFTAQINTQIKRAILTVDVFANPTVRSLAHKLAHSDVTASTMVSNSASQKQSLQAGRRRLSARRKSRATAE
ncbi:non-ribosomal peptide synthetase [Pseudoalteromonas rubra]|uniref:non-ribosomal peptide synthetase n=1 Tax=Pseudoalteromonas rubra TaxID=43658 RepID=UPI0013EE96B6|nr:non-ribosomal peptide synthetase [Pseudoalteromonas rubra]